MVLHQKDVFLGQTVKTAPFGEDTTGQFCRFCRFSVDNRKLHVIIYEEDMTFLTNVL